MAVRRINEDIREDTQTGEAYCRHRDISCCKACFAANPGLIDSWDRVYVLAAYGLEPGQVLDPAHERLSPGTVSGVV